VLATIVWSAVGSYALLKLIGAFTSLKAGTREEGLGLDVSQHGEEAYSDGEGAILVLQRSDTAATEGAGVLAAAAAEGGRS
jgi:Amt family ammonium transporter